MSEYLRTHRLVLRNFTKEDFPAVFSWRNDPDCARYQRWADTSAEAVQAYLARHSSDMFLSEKEEQHYSVADHSGLTLGELSWFYNPSDRCITLGITITPKQQGQGLAYELLRAVVERCRRHYPEMDIVALIHPRNTASLRLFQKLGFREECYAKSIESYVYTLFTGNPTNGT